MRRFIIFVSVLSCVLISLGWVVMFIGICISGGLVKCFFIIVKDFIVLKICKV